MSHDTDKLIRQLSLVAFLMAERRPLTARDIKSNVEGYQEMSDEAFARRFYSDRAELVSLGVPLDCQRDEFTGEELYTLRSERYFLPELELDDEELAALQTCFYLLEGRFAYAEPLRLALQNLALGRSAGALAATPTRTAGRVEVRDPDYSPELQGRLGKLEGAISKQRTVKFRYWSIYRDDEEERTLNPYALLPENGSWYVIGHDLERDDIRTFRVSRIRSDIRFATRRERDFRLPPSSTSRTTAAAPSGSSATSSARRRIEVAPRHRLVGRARLRRRAQPRRGRRLHDRVRLVGAARALDPAPGRPGRPARAVGAAPARRRGRARRARRARGRAADAGRRGRRRSERRRRRAPRRAQSRPSASACCSRCSRTCSTACGEEREGVIPAHELVERFSIPREQIEEHLSLLNLVNFGGGCYAVYAELHGDEVHVDKELFGDTFRRPPRLTPLEARAIRLALEFVGPMVAAGAHSPLDRVRAKLEETFGAFDLAQTPAPQVGAEEGLRRHAHAAIDEHKLVEIEYLKPEEQEVVTRTVEPYSIERRLPHWYVHTWDVERDQPRSYRLDRMRKAKRLAQALHAARRVRPGGAARRDDGAHLVLARTSRAGRSRKARGRSSTARRSPTSRSAARSGSSARWSPTAARRSCSSRRSCARASPSAPRELASERRCGRPRVSAAATADTQRLARSAAFERP